MRPLTLDDLLPLGEYAPRRHEFFASVRHYLDRYRRVRVGPRATILFENRQTLWFRVQEIVRVARLAEPRLIRNELALYNRLLPGPNQLQAALLIEITDETRLQAELAPWQTMHGSEIRFCFDRHQAPARLLTCRPGDQAIGAAHWLQFGIDAAARDYLADLTRAVVIEIALPGYRFESAPLSEDVRQSLLDDLTLSDRDTAA